MPLLDFDWAAIAVSDVLWIALAFVFGLLAKLLRLPPLVGYLCAGFILSAFGYENDELLQKLSDLGITLLLFTVGLKLQPQTLIRPQVWAVTGIHMLAISAIFSLLIFGYGQIGTLLDSDISFASSLLVAFALSFSSTVFVVKALEERGEVASLHGRVAVGILIMQDIVAVIFLAVSIGQLPSMWALLLVAVFPARKILFFALQKVGHGELLILYGFLLALGGAEIFELVGMKGDLGALVAGLIIARHSKADELAKTMLGFKDIFLLGFFLSIGLSGQLSMELVAAGAALSMLIIFKSGLFFLLLTRFKMRARNSLLATINLSNYSEFGLIVTAIAVSNGWIHNDWLIAISLALSFSFIISACLNVTSSTLYASFKPFWKKFETRERLTDDLPHETAGATVLIIGMGGIGTGAYETIRQQHGEVVVGVDVEPQTVSNHISEGRQVVLGDPAGDDFWDRIHDLEKVEMVMLALPVLNSNISVLKRLAAISFKGRIAVTAKFSDEIALLHAEGADIVFNVYTEAGAGFAAHSLKEVGANSLQAANENTAS